MHVLSTTSFSKASENLRGLWYLWLLQFCLAQPLVHTLQDFAGLLKQRICDVKGVPSHRQRPLEIAFHLPKNLGRFCWYGILWGFNGVFRICKKTELYLVRDMKVRIHSEVPAGDGGIFDAIGLGWVVILNLCYSSEVAGKCRFHVWL